MPIPKRKNFVDSYTDQTQIKEASVSDDDLILIDEATNKNCKEIRIIHTKENLKSKESIEVLVDSSDDDFKLPHDLTRSTLGKTKTDSSTVISVAEKSGDDCPKQKKSPIAIIKPYNPANDQVLCSKYFKNESLEKNIDEAVIF